MKKIISIHCLSFLFCGGLAFAADSASDRKDMSVRLGMKTGLHLFYAISAPFVLEFPGEDFTFGLVYGSGKLETTSTSSSGYTSTTVTDTWKFTTSEVTGRFYVGNSFSIPFGVAMYNIHMDEWKFLNTTWELDYTTTQLNLGIGNEWTYDWGGYLGIDWFQGGAKLSDKVSVKQTSGSVSSTSKTGAEKESTDISAFAGVLIFTFGFGF